MNNDQIRLSILYQYYRAKFNGKDFGENEENPELKDISPEAINANLDYLVGKGLINGKKEYTGAGVVIFTSDITALGMDIVEKILNQSLTELDSDVSSEIKKESTTDKRFNKLYEISSKIEPVLNIVISVAGMIFSNLR